MKLAELKEGVILTEEQWQSVYKEMAGEYRIIIIPLIDKEGSNKTLTATGLKEIVGDIPEETYSYCGIEHFIKKVDGEYTRIKLGHKTQFLIPINAKDAP